MVIGPGGGCLSSSDVVLAVWAARDAADAPAAGGFCAQAGSACHHIIAAARHPNMSTRRGKHAGTRSRLPIEAYPLSETGRDRPAVDKSRGRRMATARIICWIQRDWRLPGNAWTLKRLGPVCPHHPVGCLLEYRIKLEPEFLQPLAATTHVHQDGHRARAIP